MSLLKTATGGTGGKNLDQRRRVHGQKNRFLFINVDVFATRV